MFNIGGHNIYFPDEFTEDMLSVNETLFHNKTVYVVDWYCKDKVLTENQKFLHEAEIYDASQFITNHILVIHLIHGTSNIKDCEPVELMVKNGCDVAVNLGGKIPSFTWLQKKKKDYSFENDDFLEE